MFECLVLSQPFRSLSFSLNAKHKSVEYGGFLMSEVIGKLRQLWNATWEGFSSVQSLSYVQLCNPKESQRCAWTAACQASLSITSSWSLLKLMSIVLVMPSNHFILCRPLLLLPSIFPSMGVFSSESVLHIRWPKYWRFRFSISPSNEYSGLISFRMAWFDLLAVQGTSLQVGWFE